MANDTFIFISSGVAAPLPRILRAISNPAPNGVTVTPVHDVDELFAEIAKIPAGTCKRLDIIGHSGTKSIHLGHDGGILGENHELGVPVAAQLADAIFGPGRKLTKNAKVRFIGCFTAAQLDDLIAALQSHALCTDVTMKATAVAIQAYHYVPPEPTLPAVKDHPSAGPFGKDIFLDYKC